MFLVTADDKSLPLMEIEYLPMVSDHQATAEEEEEEQQQQQLLNPQQPAKQVRFDDSTMYIDSSREPISRQNKRDEWYTQKDFVAFERESRRLILRAKQLISGNHIDVIKSEDICLRGLEANFSTRAFVNRNARQNHALHTVLNEQRRQYVCQQEPDAEAIRQLYILQSRQSVKLAIDLARQDAEAVARDTADSVDTVKSSSCNDINNSNNTSSVLSSPKKRRTTVSVNDHFPVSPRRAPIASPRARSRRLQPQLRMDRDLFGIMAQPQPQPQPVYQVTNQFAPGVTVNIQTRTIVLDSPASSTADQLSQQKEQQR